MTKEVLLVQMKSQKNFATFFFLLEELFIMNLYQLDSQPSQQSMTDFITEPPASLCAAV